MVDNVAITAGTGTTIAADDIGAGVLAQRVKAVWGPDGTGNDIDTATGKPLPVQLRGSDGTDRSNLLPVSLASGTVASGAIASGAVASGAFASGSIASGAIASGAMVDVGAIADAAVTAGATGSLSAKLRSISRDLVANVVLAAGTNAIGKLAANSGVDIGDVDVGTIAGVAPAFGSGAVGATVQRVALATDSPGIITTGTAGSASAVVLTVQGVASMTPVLVTPPSGDVAHDAADSGNPDKLGAKATSSLSALTPVSATADRTNVFAGMDGVLLSRPHTNLEDIVTGNATNTDGTSTQCIAAQASGIKTYLTSIVLCNTSATAITVDIKDGSTVKVSLPLPAGSGCVFNPPVPIPGTAATAWNFDGSAAATTVTCSMVGFKSKV